MTVELNLEIEYLVHQEIRCGRFRSVDEMILEGVRAAREKSKMEATPRKPRKNLADFLMESPFAGSDLDLEREQDFGRPINW